jgi:3-methyl-2-oxobutanoate hydroxymethyltransferase
MFLVDMPFLSYQVSQEEALRNAGRMMQEAGAEAVKLEGGEAVAPTIARLVSAGIPVMGHLGLTPQSVHQLGGYRIQGRTQKDADRLLADARALVDAGAFGMVLEMIPADLARRVTEAVPIPTIGIGAGPHCDGQVQVFHDLFGLYPDKRFKHNRRYAELGEAIIKGASEFVCEVRNCAFPPAPDA